MILSNNILINKGMLPNKEDRFPREGDFSEGKGMSERIHGKRVRIMSRRQKMPRQEKMANSWMAVIRLTKSDPKPTTVVRTASAVGNVMLVNVRNTASAGDSAS